VGIDLEKYWWHMKYYKDKSLSSFCLDSNKKIKKCFLACANATRSGGTFSNKMGTSLCGGHYLPSEWNGMGLMLLPEVSGNNITIRVVEFSRRDTRLERFLVKNQL
jgi:hypothetical protein